MIDPDWVELACLTESPFRHSHTLSIGLSEMSVRRTCKPYSTDVPFWTLNVEQDLMCRMTFDDGDGDNYWSGVDLKKFKHFERF